MDPTIKEKKRCSKCGEIFRLSNYFWQIFRCSGIPYIKKEYSIMLCEDGIIFPKDKLNLIQNIIHIMLIIMIIKL